MYLTYSKTTTEIPLMFILRFSLINYINFYMYVNTMAYDSDMKEALGLGFEIIIEYLKKKRKGTYLSC